MATDSLTIADCDKRDPDAEGVLVKCQVFSRVCGYLTAVDNWNAGKRAEFADRRMFDVSRVEAEDGDA